MKLFTKAKEFFMILNTDALLFLGTRLASIILSITSILLLCRAVTIQQYFLTDGLGVLYDLIPLGPLVFTIVWSITSVILPGCHRKYHAGLDVALDLLGMSFSFAAGGALLEWSLEDSYEVEFCQNLTSDQCLEAANSLVNTERSGAVLLLLTGITHTIMFIRAVRSLYSNKRNYRPSRNSFVELEKGSSINQSRGTTAHSNETGDSFTVTGSSQKSCKSVEGSQVRKPSDCPSNEPSAT